MTPDERTLLTNFLRDLAQARGGPKDPEAEAMIKDALASNPDAAYLLVQHTILSDQALHAAQDRIAELERQGAGQSGGSFLGQQGPWSGPAQPSAPAPQASRYYDPQQANYGQPGYAQPAYAPPPSPFSTGGGLGSFLRAAAPTAAGVFGGEMLFEGLSGLFGGHRGFGGGFGGGWGGGYGGAPVENVTINEYNDDDGGYDDRDDNSGSDWDDGNN